MQRAQITYDQFGHAFLFCAITPQLIAAKIDQMPRRQPPQPLPDLPPGVHGDATVSLGCCTVSGRPDSGFVVTQPLHIDLNLQALGLLNESYAIEATVPLRIGVQTFVPDDHSVGAWIYMAVSPIQGAEIALTVVPESWTNVAERFFGLADKVRANVAQKMNEQLEQSDAERWFDVYKMIQDQEKAMMG
jgi:hypothetical protein